MRTLRTHRADIVHRELSYEISGICYRVHDVLGRYAREKQYCDLIAKYLEERPIPFVREAALSASGSDRNRADFVIAGKVILEAKVTPFTTREDYYQLRRYLRIAGLRLGIIVNFRQKYLRPKRVLNPDV